MSVSLSDDEYEYECERSKSKKVKEKEIRSPEDTGMIKKERRTMRKTTRL